MGILKKIVSVDELFQTVRRFPLSIVCLLALFVLCIGELHDFFDFDDEFLGRIALSALCGFVWFGCCRLIKERYCLPPIKSILLTFVGIGFIGSIIWLSTMWAFHVSMLFPSLVLFALFAPYCVGRNDDNSVWVYARTLVLASFLATVAGIIFGCGMSMGLFALDKLFNVDVELEAYADVWYFSCVLLGPIYGLSSVPKGFEFEDAADHVPPGFSFIANWVSTPIVFGYLAIIYAYFVKIVLTGDIPNGYLVYLMTGFVGTSIVTYMLSFPLRDKGTFQLKLLHKFLFPALLIPIGFHFYAILERVNAYGFTEKRYVILLSAVFFLIIALSNLRGRMPIKFIPATLSILLLLASFGPWSATNVSVYSQYSHLERLLINNDLLVGGKLVRAQSSQAVPFEDRKSISSAINFLCKHHQYGLLKTFFSQSTDMKLDSRRHKDNDILVCQNLNEINNELGFGYISRYSMTERVERFDFRKERGDVLLVRGYDYFVPSRSIHFYSGDTFKEPRIQKFKGFHDFVYSFNGSDLKIAVNNFDEVIFDVNSFANNQRPKHQDDHIFDVYGENDDLIYRIAIGSISGRIEDDTVKVRSINFNFLYRVKE